MQMDAIRLFCEVAEHHSVSEAARVHGVTQSAASQRLQSLEKELGVQLIDRSKRPLQLTPAGELFFRGCSKILQRYELLKRQVTGAEPSGSFRGEVTVAAIYSAGIDLLNRVKAEFEEQHPETTVRISYLQPDAVAEHVRDGRSEIGILSYPQRWRELKSLSLREETMVVVMRPGHPLSGAGRVHAERLTRYEMVSFDEALPIGRRIRRYLREQGGGTGENIINQFDNIDTIKTCVAETDCVAILPDRTVQREVSAGVLAAAALEPKMLRPLGIVHDRQRPLPALVQAFVEYLLDSQSSDRRPSAEGSAAGRGELPSDTAVTPDEASHARGPVDKGSEAVSA